MRENINAFQKVRISRMNPHITQIYDVASFTSIVKEIGGEGVKIHWGF